MSTTSQRFQCRSSVRPTPRLLGGGMRGIETRLELGTRKLLETLPRTSINSDPQPQNTMSESNAASEALVPKFQFERLLNQGTEYT